MYRLGEKCVVSNEDGFQKVGLIIRIQRESMGGDVFYIQTTFPTGGKPAKVTKARLQDLSPLPVEVEETEDNSEEEVSKKSPGRPKKGDAK